MTTRLPTPPGKSRLAHDRDHRWLLACLQHRHDPAWVRAQWARLQGRGSPDWKRLAVARCARRLGLALELAAPACRIYRSRIHHGERPSTWVALFGLIREGVQVGA